MSVELHAAFVWDCEYCGAENFHRAVEGNLDEAVMAAIADSMDCEPVASLVAPDAYEDGPADGDYQPMAAAKLVTQIAIAPKFVTCKECGAKDSAEVVALTEDDEDED